MKVAARMALLALVFAVPAQAQDSGAKARVEIDTNLICDTQQQIERFVALIDSNEGNAEAAIAAVNAEHGTSEACVIATAAYRRAGHVATVKNAEASFDVMRIMVVGVYTVKGLERSVPTQFFTLLPHEVESSTVGQRR